MAMFGLKEVLEPLAKEVREGYAEAKGLLEDIKGILWLQAEIAKEHRDATQETNRLLAVLVEQGSQPGAKAVEARAVAERRAAAKPTGPKTPAVKP